MADHTAPALAYFAARQCPPQWRGFLGATAREFAARFEPADLHALLHAIGTRFAADIELPDSHTVEAIEQAMSEVWLSLDWGWVEVREAEGALQLVHHCAPLAAAFGEDALGWTPAFLEGAYQQWFLQLGAGEVLRVSRVADAPAGTLVFRFGRPA